MRRRRVAQLVAVAVVVVVVVVVVAVVVVAVVAVVAAVLAAVGQAATLAEPRLAAVLAAQPVAVRAAQARWREAQEVEVIEGTVVMEGGEVMEAQVGVVGDLAPGSGILRARATLQIGMGSTIWATTLVQVRPLI